MLIRKFRKKKTYINKNISKNEIKKRTMFGRACKTTNRIYHQNLHNQVMTERPLTAIAGKSKLPKSILQEYPKEELKNNINQHAQYVTDFNLIFENSTDIRLYQIGTLFTNPTKDSYNVSNEKNYKFEDGTQQIKFFKKPIAVLNDINIIKNSKQYFDNFNIRQKVENTREFKQMFNEVLEELKAKSIKFKVAETPKDFEETGFNVLTKLNPPKEKNILLEILSIKNHEKE